MKMDPASPYIMFFDDLIKQQKGDLFIPPPNSMFAINAQNRVMIFLLPLHMDPRTMSEKEIDDVVNRAIKNSDAK